MTTHKPAITSRPVEFTTKNWRYILETTHAQLSEKGFASQKLLQKEFNKVIEERYNEIAQAHQHLALKIAREFDFKTAYEVKHQYLAIPPWMRKAKAN